MIISICSDVAALKEHVLIKMVDGEIPMARSRIMNTGGTNIHYNGNYSVCCLSGVDGLEELAELDCITVTSYEEIFGYTVSEIIDEVETITTIEPIQAMRDLYDLAYPRTPIITDDGTYTPPALMGISGGYDASHLTV